MSSRPYCGIGECTKREVEAGIWPIRPRLALARVLNSVTSDKMLIGLLFIVVATVILVLYHKVKTWEERQGA